MANEKILDDANAAAKLGLGLTDEEQEQQEQERITQEQAPKGEKASQGKVLQEQVSQEQAPQEQIPQEQTPQEQESGSPEKLSWEERAKKWQSNFTKEQEKAKQLERENELIRNFMAAARNQQPAQPVQEQPKKKIEEPRLEDFIDEDYDSSDAFDARTKSGRAYQKWLSVHDKWLSETTKSDVKREIMEEMQRDKRQQLVMQRAKRLAERFPEFRDPITGEVDLHRIQQRLFQEDDSDPDAWLTYAEYLEWRKDKQNGSGETKTINAADVVSQIERNANAPTSVIAAQSASGKPEELDEEDIEMSNYFEDWRPIRR